MTDPYSPEETERRFRTYHTTLGLADAILATLGCLAWLAFAVLCVGGLVCCYDQNEEIIENILTR